MIRLENISWSTPGFALREVSFTVPAGRYAVLMGRTGTGKTSLLEMLCGLREPQSGKVWLGDRDVTHETPGARGIGYVPQDGALFTTMTVREQIGFGLRMQRKAAAGGEHPIDGDEILDRTDLGRENDLVVRQAEFNGACCALECRRDDGFTHHVSGGQGLRDARVLIHQSC